MRRFSFDLASPLLITVCIGLFGCTEDQSPTGPAAQAATASAVVAKYTVVELGTLGGDRSFAKDINQKGEVVGWSSLGTGGQRAFRWKGGVMRDIGTLSGPSVANAINDAGIIVGWSYSKSSNRRATRWGDGKIKNLGTLGGLESEAADISPTGIIVGWAHNAAGVTRAFRWQNGSMQDLGTLGGSFAVATAINRAGIIVGYSATASGQRHAFRWKDGVMQDLGAMGRRSSGAFGLNNQGVIVGQVGPVPDAGEDESDVADVFIWNKGSVTIRHPGSPFFAAAEDVNADGIVVGTTSDFEDEFDFADGFVIEGGVVTVLDQIGAGSQRMLGGAEAINPAGDIVGFRAPFVPYGGFEGSRAILWRRKR